MMRLCKPILATVIGISLFSGTVTADDAVHVIPHESLHTYSFYGNTLTGVATKGLGASQYEAWKTSIAPGSATPLHSHNTEEIFIFWRGKGKAVTEFEEVEFEAPCTLILPANIKHQIFNTGDIPTQAVVIMGVDTVIYNANDQEMSLPWRN